MLDGFRRRRTGSGRGPRRRLGGCLLWILGLIVALIILSLLFGGFQKGTKASLAGAPAPVIAPALSDDKVRALYEEGSYEVIPLDNMRRTIAQRLTASTQTIPHFYLTIDCVIDKLTAAREEINAAAPKDKDGKAAYKLSVNDFVVKALALALRKISNANVSWTDSGLLSGLPVLAASTSAQAAMS